MSVQSTPQRFAHPFYTATPPDQRPEIPGIGKRMLDFVAAKLEKIPDPRREPTMTLADIIGAKGAAEIEHAQSITFHAVGDTGHDGGLMQELVSEAMAADYKPAHPEKSPAFLLHLGDVIYFNNTDQGYQSQFYVPYKRYPGKIIAIPGNHDGELFKFDGTSTGQKTTLAAFQKNFCQPKPGVPAAAGTIYREMVSQPGVYWLLTAPFIDIIGLYSNIGEGPGFISAQEIGHKQKDWLVKTLADVNKKRKQGARKALVIAVHHPPFSFGGHSGSAEMLQDIDDACNKSGIMPDAVLAAHAHNYQRYTRFLSFQGRSLEIPFIIAGSGGRGLGPVPQADGHRTGDHTFERSLMGYGYLTVTATVQQLRIGFTHVDKEKKAPFDKIITVNLKTNQLHLSEALEEVDH